MKVSTMIRRSVKTVRDAENRLNAIALRCGITTPVYEDSEADTLSEFDALAWICLCAQRKVLMKRTKIGARHMA
jgi:hypothetical protein